MVSKVVCQVVKMRIPKSEWNSNQAGSVIT